MAKIKKDKYGITENVDIDDAATGLLPSSVTCISMVRLTTAAEIDALLNRNAASAVS